MNDKTKGVPVFDVKQQPRSKGFKTNDNVDALLRKLVKPITPPVRQNGNTLPASNLVNYVVGKTASARIDADNMIQTLPDINIVKQVLISSILSPNDMMSNELTIESTADDLAGLREVMLKIIRDYFTETYKISQLLPKWLEEALFISGAQPIAIIPESSIDDIINGGNRVNLESIKNNFLGNGLMKPLGLLGNPIGKSNGNFGIEAMGGYTPADYDPSVGMGTHVFIHDNYDAFKMPEIMKRVSNERIQATYAARGYGLESVNKKVDKTNKSIYPHRNFKLNTVATIKTLAEIDKPTTGHPCLFYFPSEAVIPVFAPSEPDNHIAYFVALDSFGHPVKSRLSEDFFAQLQYNQGSLRDMNSELLSQTRRATEGRRNSINENIIIEEHQRLYGEILEEQMMARLATGVGRGLGLKVGRNEELYRVMLARSFQQMSTQLVLIPAELMVYFAFDHNDFGVGKSLLDNTRIIAGLRAVLLFANVNAGVKNSVQHTSVNLKLDPDDPDPDVTVEAYMHDLIRLRHQNLPIGIINPTDISSHIAMAGISITTEGNENYPDMSAEVNQLSANNVQPDSSLMENLQDQQIQGMGVPPEIIELSRNVEFATQAVSSNILFAKNCMLKQDVAAQHTTNVIRIYTGNSQPLMDRLLKVIAKGRKNLKIKDSIDDMDIVHYFIRSIVVSLPRPDLSQIEMQLTSFQKYSEILDLVLPAFVNSDIFNSSNMGSLSDSVDTTIAILKAHYQRRWLQSNNVLPELFELIDFDNKSGIAFDLLDQHETYIKTLGKSLKHFMEKSMLRIQKTDEEINKFKEATGVDTSSDTSSSDDSGSDSGDEGDGDSGGDDDFGDFGDFGDGGDEETGDTSAEGDDAEADTGSDTSTDDKEEDKKEDKPEEDNADEKK